MGGSFGDLCGLWCKYLENKLLAAVWFTFSSSPPHHSGFLLPGLLSDHGERTMYIYMYVAVSTTFKKRTIMPIDIRIRTSFVWQTCVAIVSVRFSVGLHESFVEIHLYESSVLSGSNLESLESRIQDSRRLHESQRTHESMENHVSPRTHESLENHESPRIPDSWKI